MRILIGAVIGFLGGCFYTKQKKEGNDLLEFFNKKNGKETTQNAMRKTLCAKRYAQNAMRKTQDSLTG